MCCWTKCQKKSACGLPGAWVGALIVQAVANILLTEALALVWLVFFGRVVTTTAPPVCCCHAPSVAGGLSKVVGMLLLPALGYAARQTC